ncbi:hypothetical protein DAH51_21810 [Sphingobium yanoikuyae]|uniref:Uncharacterized protein n=1 Tax=Sphingobium yanoikuyae TaxID=13690 RepID=A0A430BK63_SPHYA|nr:hypothetical protein DAH51_21810 [Sphingobium yanoikuyae]
MFERVAFRILRQAIAVGLPPPFDGTDDINVIAIVRSVLGSRPLDLCEWMGTPPTVGVAVRQPKRIRLPLLTRCICKLDDLSAVTERAGDERSPIFIQPPAARFFKGIEGFDCL